MIITKKQIENIFNVNLKNKKYNIVFIKNNFCRYETVELYWYDKNNIFGYQKKITIKQFLSKYKFLNNNININKNFNDILSELINSKIKKKYNEMSCVNEFFGIPYDKNTDKLIKKFIFDEIEKLNSNLYSI